jgi:hypothetical protein
MSVKYRHNNSVTFLIYPIKETFCLFALLSIFFPMTIASETDSIHFEVWELNSFEIIGGHSVQVSGNPQIVNTEYGKAIKFDGIDDKLLVDNNPIGDATEFTVEVIFKPYPGYDIGNAPRFIHFQDPDDSLCRRVLIELRLTRKNEWYLDGFMLTDIEERTLVDSTLKHPVGEWFHAAITFKDNTFKTYVNGIQELSGKICFAEKLINKIGKTSIGGRMDKRNYYCGLIKTLKITRKALEPKDFIRLNSGN